MGCLTGYYCRTASKEMFDGLRFLAFALLQDFNVRNVDRRLIQLCEGGKPLAVQGVYLSTSFFLLAGRFLRAYWRCADLALASSFARPYEKRYQYASQQSASVLTFVISFVTVCASRNPNCPAHINGLSPGPPNRRRTLQ